MNYILRNVITAVATSCAIAASAQDFAQQLSSIEQNSLALQTLRKQIEAEVEELSLEKRLEDPEVGVGYLWGGDAGNRVDLEVCQAFDLPMAYVKKKKAVAEKQRLANMNYQTERQKELLKAKQLCIQVVYCNAVLSHLNKDLAQTHASSEAYETLFEKGQATIVDRNKAKQACLFFHVEEQDIRQQKRNLLAELAVMNGGKEVVITDSVFNHDPLPLDFDAWLNQTVEQHPQYLEVMQKIQAQEAETRQVRNEWWPKLKVGYQSEKTTDEHFQGITAGLTLPVWSTAKKTKVVQLRAEAAKMEGDNQRQELMLQLKNAYEGAKAISSSFDTYKTYMKDFDNSALLKKSLDAGQITLLTYLQELQYLHELNVKLLDAEKEYALRRAELDLF